MRWCAMLPSPLRGIQDEVRRAIADTLERQLITRHELMEGAGDWAVRTSTVARDVFYYRNLNLGQRLTATLRRFDRVGENIILHTALTAESDGAALADIFTAKRVLAPTLKE